MVIEEEDVDRRVHDQAADSPIASRETLDELLTVEDVAKLLKVSRSWVYEHTRSRGTRPSDRLPHLKLGKYVRFQAAAVRAFLNQKCHLM